MERPISEADLCEFLAGKCDPQMHAEIVRQMDIMGSPVHKWFEEMDRKLEDPLNIDWGAIALSVFDEQEAESVDDGEVQSATPLSLEERWKIEDQVKEIYVQARQAYENGKYKEALATANEGFDLCRKVLGRGPQMMGLANLLGMIHTDFGRYQEAEQMLVASVELADAFYADDRPYGVALANVGGAFVRQGKLRQAEHVLREAVRVLHEHAVEAPEDFAGALSDLGWVCLYQGNDAEAERLMRAAVRMLGTWKQAFPLSNLADLDCYYGRYADAEDRYRRALGMVERERGRRDPAFTGLLNRLGQLYETMGRYTEAEQLLREATESDRELFGEGHPDYARDLNNLGSLLYAMGDYKAARELYALAKDICFRVYGAEHENTAVALNNLAAVAWTMGDDQTAAAWLQETVNTLNAIEGMETETAIAGHNLGNVLLQRGEFDEARVLLEQSLNLLQQSLGSDDLGVGVCLCNLAQLYHDTGDIRREETLARGEAIVKRYLGESHPIFSGATNVIPIRRRYNDVVMTVAWQMAA